MKLQPTPQNPEFSPKPDKLLSRQEAAEVLGIKGGTLAVWHTTKRYPLAVIKVGRLAKYRLSDIEDFLAQRTISNGRPPL